MMLAVAQAASDDEGRWDGGADHQIDLSSVPESDDAFAEALDIHPDDEVAESVSDEPRRRLVGRQPLDGAADEFPEKPISPSRLAMSSLDSLVALAKIGKMQGAAARFEAYMAPLPLERRERILMIMENNGWKTGDPEIVVAMLMGHLEAIGHTIPMALDAKMVDIEQRLSSVLEAYADVPQLIEEALGAARVLAEELAGIVRSEGDGFSARLGDALRDVVFDASAKSVGALDAHFDLLKKNLAKESDIHEGELKTAMKGFYEQLGSSSLKIAADVVRLVEAKIAPTKADNHWKTAAIVLGSLLLGAATAHLFKL